MGGPDLQRESELTSLNHEAVCEAQAEMLPPRGWMECSRLFTSVSRKCPGLSVEVKTHLSLQEHTSVTLVGRLCILGSALPHTRLICSWAEHPW